MNSASWYAFGLTPLEQGLNYYLKLDPAWPSWIAPLRGKTLSILLRPLSLRTLIYVGSQGFRLSIDDNAPSDAEIIGSPSTLLTYLITRQMSPLLHDGRLQLLGDLSCIQAFEQLMQQIQADWEALLADLIGDTAAYRLGQAFLRTKAACHRGGEMLGRQLTDYLQDELLLLPARALLEDFYCQVDNLRETSDRLAARIARLKSSLLTNAKDRI